MSFDIGARHDAIRTSPLPDVIHQIIIAYGGNEVVSKHTIAISKYKLGPISWSDSVSVASIDPLVTCKCGLLYVNNIPRPIDGLNFVLKASPICGSRYVITTMHSLCICDIDTQEGYTLLHADVTSVFQGQVYYLTTSGVVYQHLSQDNNKQLMEHVSSIYRRGDYLFLKCHGQISYMYDGQSMRVVLSDTFALYEYDNMTLRVANTKIEMNGLEMVLESNTRLTHQKQHLVLIQTMTQQYVWDFKRKQMYTLDPLPTIYQVNNVLHHIEPTQIVVYD